MMGNEIDSTPADARENLKTTTDVKKKKNTQKDNARLVLMTLYNKLGAYFSAVRENHEIVI